MPHLPTGSPSLFEPDALHSLVLDSLEEQIAVIDREGSIIYVNRAEVAVIRDRFNAPFGAREKVEHLRPGCGHGVCPVSVSLKTHRLGICFPARGDCRV